MKIFSLACTCNQREFIRFIQFLISLDCPVFVIICEINMINKEPNTPNSTKAEQRQLPAVLARYALLVTSKTTATTKTVQKVRCY